ncbi:phage tail spike protein [Leuconostoc lactis]|uniref:phage tail spike protein n=1 Tax=Leuconostoc lactis TaxID=1246 RepID=UPI0021C12A84|nr:phage tail spike protein [Leuconostoc lactis]MCT8388340.1 hypothetical protein [Leuconostoc lactis]
MSSPIIFEKGTRDFSTLGLGLLSDAIQATTTEELNGQFIFEMDYPVSGNNADLIKENRIIIVNSGHILKRQGFIIRQIVRKIDLTMTVYAEHVSYATLDVALAPVGTISGDAKTALENWKRMLVPAVDFTVDSDILTTNSTSIGAPEFETARQGLGGHAGSILDVWGGEYQFDNWHIRLLKQRGKSANAIIAYGRNLISFEQDTNIADTYTSVYPYYQENSGDEGNKNHFLPERTVDSEFVGKYPNPKVLMLDLSNKFKDVADYSETKLRNYALSYIQSNNIGVPKVNMKISTVDLSRATGGFSEDIDLGDTVNVYFEKLGITTSAKVIKAVWNVLSDYYDKFEIGARRSSLTESVSELATTADENANKALNQALVALQSADGKTTIYYLDSSDPWPTNPKENDTAFVKDGENSIMYRYMFNNDTGVFSWVKILDSMSAGQIKQRVSDALESGKAYSDQLVADNVAQVNTVLDDVQAKQADLSSQQAELDTKAQGYADKALADAKADTLATATQTAKDTQEYTNTAKAEAISTATKADGVINKKIDDTASSITSTISQNKTDADGKITTAQSTATQALNGLATKVSQSDYNAKTGDLTTKVNTAQSTADSATSTISAYKTSNDARVASAESKITANASAITSKVSQSDYNTKTGQIDGQISSIKQTATSISQSVADVNGRIDNISVGGTNLLLGSQDFTGTGTERWVISGTIVANAYQGLSAVQSAGVWSGPKYQESNLVSRWGALDTVHTFTLSEWVRNTSTTQVDIKFYGDNVQGSGLTVATLPANSDWIRVSAQFKFLVATPSSGARIRFEPITAVTGGYVQHAGMKLESGTLASSYSPAPEDTDNKISTVSQTVDSISSIVSDPTTGLTKRVQTAEGSVSTVQSNVSDLQSKQTQTANGLTTEISNRATGDANTLTQAKDFTTSSISNSESGMRSQITQTSDAILGKVGAVNLFSNSEFEKDYGYRTKNPGVTLSLDTKNQIGTQYNGTVNVAPTSTGWQGYWARNIEVQGGQKYSGSVLVHYTNGGVTGGNAVLDIWFIDKDGNRINQGTGGSRSIGTGQVSSPYWVKLYFEGVTAPDNAVNLQVSLLTNDKGVGQTAMFTQPMVTATEKLQPYTPNNDITTQLALLKDNWSIGIADNAGAITNGIVGNSTNMSLISNNVVINAPSTQIKGTAWINSAMIGNGAIGTAQIGDAAITSAKIANLDVSKITGNVTNFIQSNWNGVFASTMIDNTGMSINGGNTTTKFDTTGAHYSNSSGINATYSFGKWSDSNSNATSATGLYIGATGSSNAFINILSTNGAAALVLAGTAMDFGSNLNVLQGALNAYVNVNIRERLMFKANRYVGGQPSYIEVDEINRTFNFFTGGGSGTNKDYFYFNQNVISAGTFSSTSVLSKKNVKSVYDEDALGEIAKTQLVNFEYKNRIGQNHVSPIIDDVNSEKEYYIPKTILGQDNEYVDMYSMISMAWRAIQQINEKIGDK